LDDEDAIAEESLEDKGKKQDLAKTLEES